MAGWYPGLRTLHIAAVVISGSLFALRGVAVQIDANWAMQRPVRFLSYGIDSVLLAAALLLVASLPTVVFASGWLSAPSTNSRSRSAGVAWVVSQGPNGPTLCIYFLGPEQRYICIAYDAGVPYVLVDGKWALCSP